MSVRSSSSPDASAAASLIVPGLGQFLSHQPLLGAQYLLTAVLLWPLCLMILGDAVVVTGLAVVCLLSLHAGAFLTARAGARRLAGVGDPADAGREYRRWGVIIASLVVALIAFLFLRWAAGLPNWDTVWRNLMFLLIGRFISDDFAGERWRLLGFALIAVGILATYLLNRARVRHAWTVLLVSLIAGAVALYPAVSPTVQVGGLALSLILAVMGILLALPIGMLFGVGRASELPFVRGVSSLYIELFRGVPFIAVIFWFYIFVPYVLGEGTQFTAVVLALGLFTGAYVAEIIRAGLRALPRGQAEAARSLGLSGTQAMLLVILPQALRSMVPPLVGQFISLFKDTSLVSIISFIELFGAGRITANRVVTATFEIYLTVALLYFVFAYALSLVARRLEAPRAAR